MMEYLHKLETLELATFNQFLYFWLALSILSGLIIFFGKQLPISNRIENTFIRKLGGSIDKKTGWVLMEIPILIMVIYFYVIGDQPINASVVMVAVFVMHYINRAIIFPQRIKVKGKTMPVISMLASMIFYIINGYLIGHYFGSLTSYPIEWLYDPRFIIGLLLFLGGFIINIQSDNILINLRKPGETGYKIPYGKGYKYVSCPNYMGECIEWIGFAIMCWNFTAFVYATWVVIPLFFQARGAHQWYKEKFGEAYPSERKAIIPKLL